MTRINTNVSSLVAQNRLNRTNADLQTSLTRLSTGLRINTGKDDPAGLIASESLRSDITSINKAISNTRRATQIIATADSALGQVSSLLNDVRGLVVEAANTGALSKDEIAANQLQVDSSLAAINRIAQTTTFQGRKLLDGSLDFNTTSGTNFTKLSKVQINQANLGSSGTVNLKIDISSAATRAEVEVANISASGTGTGSITLTSAAPNAEASTGSLTTVAGADFSIDAKDGTSLDGTAGNAVSVNISSGATAATGQAATAIQSVNGGAGDYTVSIKSGGTYDGGLGNAVTVNISSGNTATAQAESAAQNVNGVTGAFTVSAKAGGAFDGAAGNVLNVEIVSTNGATGISEAGGTVTIAVDDTSSVSLDDIAAALAGNADFEFNVTSGLGDTLFRNDGSDDLSGGSAFALNAGTAGTDAVATYSLDTTVPTAPVLNIIVNDNQDEALTAIKAALEADFDFANNFQFNVGISDDFQADGSDDAAAVALTGGTNEAAEVTFTNNVLNITVDNTQAVAVSAIKASLDANTTFSDFFALTVTTDNNFALNGSDDISAAPLTGGTDTTTEDVITVTGPDGEESNGTISFVQATGQGAPSAAVDADGNITITVDDSANTSLAAIISAIETDLSGYSAELTTNGGDATFSVATDSFATTALSGATDGGVSDDLVFELGGESGSQVFQIAAGTTIDELVSQINLVSEATGVRAEADGTSLKLQSTTYGEDAKVDLRIIDEDENGTFTSAVGVRTLVRGKDVVAKINGVDASGDGNSLRVNTSTLDIQLSLEAGFKGEIDFTITGGGAQFQLGPEVVANQQARIGIGSLNTAQLGGVAGKLYQLGEGGSASLANNTTLASQIVDEAINQVTGLRGRLGAFQATALESNLVSLSETVNNLTEAESSIRDADFAAESARLTRNQILVQSGTNVLALANQNPQNVLALLR